MEEAPHVSAQSAPDFTSTLRGTDSSRADSITSTDEGLERAELAFRHLEEQLVVHLQEHPAPEAARG